MSQSKIHDMLVQAAEHHKFGQLAKAETLYRQILAADAAQPDALHLLGMLAHQAGRYTAAIALIRQSLALRPDFGDAHWSMALSMLMCGQFESGWEEYEWRWKSKSFPSPIRHFRQPLWNGEDLSEKTILLHAEQGFGDTIQFARYIPLVAQRAKKVIVECQPELIPLFKDMPGVAEIFPLFVPLPAFDFHAPFLSLPRAFKTTVATIPRNVPYITPLPEKVEYFKRLLMTAWGEKAAQKGPCKIGLVWAGSSTYGNDRHRSMQLAALAPWFKIPGISFVSLQVGPPTNQIVSSGLPITDFAEHLKDFSDTAALIANLDLVISVDTSVVHVSGAMGKPVWVMVTKVPDWRWLTERVDSPWYPSLRLFRCASDNWAATIDDVAAALLKQYGPPSLSDKIIP